jgi:hypothetical protein
MNPMNNVYLVTVACDYYVELAKRLTASGYNIKIVGAGGMQEYWPRSLDAYISAVNAKVALYEDFNFPERFERILDPDYSVLSLDIFSELAYYEKLFLMSTDRLAFFPISQIDRNRLFYRFIGHFYKIFRTEQIDSVVFFGTPHGPWSIALFGLAKALKMKVVYTDWVGLSPALTAVESDLHVRRTYSAEEEQLGLIANPDESARIHDIVMRNVNADFVWNGAEHLNLAKVFVRKIGSLLLRKPFGDYVAPEFFLNAGRRTRIGYIGPLVRYYLEVRRALQFYDRHATDELPDGNSLVLFLHQQPEASTMPLGGLFADQLLILDMILGALPKDMKVYVKEHPYMFEAPAQERHERSVEFYAHMLKDPRVRFVKRTVNSNLLVKDAKYVASICGSVSWEAMRAGKPCIIFGWAWYAECKSCFSVDSVESLKTAFRDAARKSREDVLKDVQGFLAWLEKRLIYGAACRPALNFLSKDYSYEKGLANVARAIDMALECAPSSRENRTLTPEAV